MATHRDIASRNVKRRVAQLRENNSRYSSFQVSGCAPEFLGVSLRCVSLIFYRMPRKGAIALLHSNIPRIFINISSEKSWKLHIIDIDARGCWRKRNNLNRNSVPPEKTSNERQRYDSIFIPTLPCAVTSFSMYRRLDSRQIPSVVAPMHISSKFYRISSNSNRRYHAAISTYRSLDSCFLDRPDTYPFEKSFFAPRRQSVSR